VNLKNVIQTPAIIAVTPINTAMVENTHLLSLPVHPCRIANPTANPTQTLFTPMGYAAAAYTYWRGTINYRFQFVGTAFQQMTLAFVWVPDGKTDGILPGGYTENASYLYQHVVEVQGPREINCPIPYLGRQEAKIVGILGELASSLDPYDDEAPMWESWNGVLHVYLVNKLIAPNNVPTTVDMVTWVSAGPDMEFHEPNAANVAGIFPRSDSPELTWNEVSLTAPEAELKAASRYSRSPFLKRVMELAGYNPGQSRMTSISTSASMAEEPNVQEGAPDRPAQTGPPMARGPTMPLAKMFGESHMDMYAYMKRLQKVFHHEGGNAVGYGPASSDHTSYIVMIPVTPQLAGNSSNTSATVEAIYNTPLAYFSCLGFYWRGGLEYRLVFTNPNVMSNISNVKAMFVPLPYAHYGDVHMKATVALPSTTDYGVSTTWARLPDLQNASPHYQDFLDKYGFELEQTYQQGTLSVTVPYMSHMPYSPLGANTPAFSTTDMTKQYYPLETVTGWLAIQITTDLSGQAQLPVIVGGADPVFKLPNFDLYIAAGDDFKYYLQAPPGRSLLYPLTTRSLPKD
jgi:hypothetical protein